MPNHDHGAVSDLQSLSMFLRPHRRTSIPGQVGDALERDRAPEGAAGRARAPGHGFCCRCRWRASSLPRVGSGLQGLGLGGSAAGRLLLRRGDGVWGRPCRQQLGPRIRARGCGPGRTNVALPGSCLWDGRYGDMKSRFPAPEITLRAVRKRRRSRWGRRKRASLRTARGAWASAGVHRTPSTRAKEELRGSHLRPLLLLHALLRALLLHRCSVQ